MLSSKLRVAFLLFAALAFCDVTSAQEEPPPPETQVDLAVAKTGPDFAAPGETVTYTVAVTNYGPEDDALSVVLTDEIPAGMTFSAFTQLDGPAFNCPVPTDPPVITCTLNLMPAGASATFAFQFTIDGNAAAGTQFTNIAEVSSETFESNGENNASATVTTIPFPPQGDLSVSKSAPAAAAPDSDVTYTITLINGGPGAASAVQIDDTLPGDMTFVSLTQSGTALSCTTPAIGSGGTASCTAATYPAGGSTTLTLTGHVPSGAPEGTEYLNVAQVSSANDPNEENNVASTALVVSTVDLVLTKTGPADQDAGSSIIYTITVLNEGPSAAIAVAVSDILPAGTVLTDFDQIAGPPAACTVPPAGTHGTVTCTVPSLDPLSQLQFALSVDPQATTSVTNTATVTTESIDVDDTNDSDTVVTTVNQRADLTVSKSVIGSVAAGNNVTYQVTLQNLGPSVATAVSLVDAVPANATFVSATPAPGFSCTTPPSGGTGNIECTTPSLAPLASATFTFVMQVSPSATGTIDNTAVATSATVDPVPGNNSATTSSPVVVETDVLVTKSGFATVVPGETVTYTVTVLNNGPADASTVVLTDVTPANTTFVSASQSSGPTFNCTSPAAGGSGPTTCSIGVLPASASASFVFVFAVDPAATGSISNTASMTTTTSQTATNNDQSTAMTVLEPSADLSVTKTGPAAVTTGQNVTYTVTASNAGQSAAANVTLTDFLSSDTTFVSSTQTSGPTFSCTTPAVGSTGTIVCTIASLAPGTTATFEFVANVNPGAPAAFENRVTIASPTTDPDPADNEDAVTSGIDPGPTDLSITKTASGTSFARGTVVTYTIVVTNEGPSVAFGTTVSDVLPPGTSFVSSTPAGACTGTATIVCDVGVLAPSESFTITLDVRLPFDDGPVSNTATVTAANAETDGGDNLSTSALAVVAEIPSLSQWGLILLAAMLTLVGAMTLRN